MVRRRIPKSRAGGKSKARPLDRNQGKIKKWDKPADIPLDEEDECTYGCAPSNSMQYEYSVQSTTIGIGFCWMGVLSRERTKMKMKSLG